MLWAFAPLSVVNVWAASDVKKIDSFNYATSRSVKMSLTKAKTVSVSDRERAKVLDVVADFAKPGTWPYVSKVIVPGTINRDKYKALRFFCRGNDGTSFSVVVTSGHVESDGHVPAYSYGVKTQDKWTQVTIPFDAFKTYEQRIWKNGAQVKFPSGEPIKIEDFEKLSEIRFVFSVEGRGKATVGHLMIDDLALVKR
ncbi:MAG: hypothetical protein WCO60_19305 [Verrucomicrobiota bacterium]